MGTTNSSQKQVDYWIHASHCRGPKDGRIREQNYHINYSKYVRNKPQRGAKPRCVNDEMLAPDGSETMLHSLNTKQQLTADVEPSSCSASSFTHATSDKDLTQSTEYESGTQANHILDCAEQAATCDDAECNAVGVPSKCAPITGTNLALEESPQLENTPPICPPRKRKVLSAQQHTGCSDQDSSVSTAVADPVLTLPDEPLNSEMSELNAAQPQHTADTQTPVDDGSQSGVTHSCALLPSSCTNNEDDLPDLRLKPFVKKSIAGPISMTSLRLSRKPKILRSITDYGTAAKTVWRTKHTRSFGDASKGVPGCTISPDEDRKFVKRGEQPLSRDQSNADLLNISLPRGFSFALKTIKKTKSCESKCSWPQSNNNKGNESKYSFRGSGKKQEACNSLRFRRGNPISLFTVSNFEQKEISDITKNNRLCDLQHADASQENEVVRANSHPTAINLSKKRVSISNEFPRFPTVLSIPSKNILSSVSMQQIWRRSSKVRSGIKKVNIAKTTVEIHSDLLRKHCVEAEDSQSSSEENVSTDRVQAMEAKTKKKESFRRSQDIVTESNPASDDMITCKYNKLRSNTEKVSIETNQIQPGDENNFEIAKFSSREGETRSRSTAQNKENNSNDVVLIEEPHSMLSSAISNTGNSYFEPVKVCIAQDQNKLNVTETQTALVPDAKSSKTKTEYLVDMSNLVDAEMRPVIHTDMPHINDEKTINFLKGGVEDNDVIHACQQSGSASAPNLNIVPPSPTLSITVPTLRLSSPLLQRALMPKPYKKLTFQRVKPVSSWNSEMTTSIETHASVNGSTLRDTLIYSSPQNFKENSATETQVITLTKTPCVSDVYATSYTTVKREFNEKQLSVHYLRERIKSPDLKVHNSPKTTLDNQKSSSSTSSSERQLLSIKDENLLSQDEDYITQSTVNSTQDIFSLKPLRTRLNEFLELIDKSEKCKYSNYSSTSLLRNHHTVHLRRGYR